MNLDIKECDDFMASPGPPDLTLSWGCKVAICWYNWKKATRQRKEKMHKIWGSCCRRKGNIQGMKTWQRFLSSFGYDTNCADHYDIVWHYDINNPLQLLLEWVYTHTHTHSRQPQFLTNVYSLAQQLSIHQIFSLQLNFFRTCLLISNTLPNNPGWWISILKILLLLHGYYTIA